MEAHTESGSKPGCVAPLQQVGPRLPYDVQVQVIESLFSESEGRWPETVTLANCAATCSDWRRIAMPGLYQRIEIIGREKYQILQNNLRMKQLATSVHTLSIHDVTPEERISHAALHTLPQRLEELRELLMFGPLGSKNSVFHVHPTLFVTLRQFRSVLYLHLQEIELASLEELRRIVGTLPSVETATFRSISWKTSEGVFFRPLHNTTSWRLSQFSLCDCSSDFVAPLFWAHPPGNASASSRRRSFQRIDGCHPPIHQSDVIPILDLAKFILDPPERMVGSICWEWRFIDVQRIWCLECCIDNGTSPNTLPRINFYFSDRRIIEDSLGALPSGRVEVVEISRNEQAGLDFERLNSLLEGFECLCRLDLKFGRTDPHPESLYASTIRATYSYRATGRFLHANQDVDSISKDPAVIFPEWLVKSSIYQDVNRESIEGQQ
ncbi:hypothetical protein NLI96_g13116 [Meripilus lineatus]|uniref:F-box domain-containing protein n=1 Tax=Meripilus lineatus TaxID=2056292 RepID=A0AAD5USJ3_9APHY|nr:hypothetical protein NLI96_g13116 [Physisporinus lineatus]